jgi:hypothetical protein
MSDETVRVGSRLWKWDENRRVYARSAERRSFGSPIYAEHFVEVEVVAETGRSWIVASPGRSAPVPPFTAESLRGTYAKVGKDLLRERVGRYGHTVYFTDAQKAAMIWTKTHSRKIVELVERCRDVATLRAIAALVGYDTGPSGGSP